jgi:hypothetical protein
MRCENCDTENTYSSGYCAGCGAKLVYDEEFFKRENNVDSLPKLSTKVKPISAFHKGKWRTVLFQRLFNTAEGSGRSNVEEDAENPKNAKSSGRIVKLILTFLIVTLMMVGLVFTRVLR